MAVPAEAGSGDVLVKRGGSAYADLSNAWPFEALEPTCIPGKDAYRVAGESDGSDWCIRVTHCGARKAVSITGVPAGTDAAGLAALLAAEIGELGPYRRDRRRVARRHPLLPVLVSRPHGPLLERIQPDERLRRELVALSRASIAIRPACSRDEEPGRGIGRGRIVGSGALLRRARRSWTRRA